MLDSNPNGAIQKFTEALEYDTKNVNALVCRGAQCVHLNLSHVRCSVHMFDVDDRVFTTSRLQSFLRFLFSFSDLQIFPSGSKLYWI